MISVRFDFETPEAAAEFLLRNGAAGDATAAPEAAAPAKNKGGRPRKTAAPGAAPAAAPAPAASANPAPAAVAVTVEEVRAKLNLVREKDGSKAARALLVKYAPSMTDLKPADYGAVYADACAALGEGQQAADDDFLN